MMKLHIEGTHRLPCREENLSQEAMEINKALKTDTTYSLGYMVSKP